LGGRRQYAVQRAPRATVGRKMDAEPVTPRSRPRHASFASDAIRHAGLSIVFWPDSFIHAELEQENNQLRAGIR
jgi:hypothetical protein